MLEMPKLLNDDLAEARELFRFCTPEFSTRTMVRTMAAEFETRIFLLGEFLIELHQTGKDSFQLTHEELHALKSESISIRRNGELTTSQRFFPFQERMLFVLKVAARLINPEGAPDMQNKNWPSVAKFISIRNRLTHPKTLADLEVTEEEIDDLNRAQDWIRESLHGLFNKGGLGDAIRQLASADESATQHCVRDDVRERPRRGLNST